MKTYNYSEDFSHPMMKFCRYMEDFPFPDTEAHFHLFGTEYPKMHSHDYWEFFLITSGSIVHRQPGYDEVVGVGDLFLIRPFDRHCFVRPMEQGYQQLNVMVTDRVFRILCEAISPDLYDAVAEGEKPVKIFLGDDERKQLIDSVHLVQTLSEDDYANFQALIRIMYLQTLKHVYYSLLHVNNSYPAWLNRFLAQIKKPENILLPVNELCSLTNFSHSHLARLFKTYTGKTLVNFLMELKLSYAAKLLQTTDLIVLDISSKVGYSSLSHFNRVFKATYHLTPSEYRNKSKHSSLVPLL